MTKELDLKDMFGEELIIECDVKDEKSGEIKSKIRAKLKHFNKYDFERMKVVAMIDGISILANETYTDLLLDVFDKVCEDVSYKSIKAGDVEFIQEEPLTLDVVTKRYYLHNITKTINENIIKLKKK